MTELEIMVMNGASFEDLLKEAGISAKEWKEG